METGTERQHAHELIERLPPAQLQAVLHLLEVMIAHSDDEALTEDERQAVASSREYFRRNPEGGLSFEEVVADLGFTMDQIRGSAGH